VTCDKFIDDYINKGLLKRQKVGFDQIDKLIIRARKDLESAHLMLKNDPPWAYNCAYSAMLHSARAFIFTKGFRPTTNFQHKTVVEFIGHYFGQKFTTLVEKFNRMRKNRNLFMYEPWKINISKTDAENALKTTTEFIELIAEEIKKEHPQKNLNF